MRCYLSDERGKGEEDQVPESLHVQHVDMYIYVRRSLPYKPIHKGLPPHLQTQS